MSDTVHQALITHTGEFKDTRRIYLRAEHRMIVYTYLITDFGIVGQVVWSLSVGFVS